mgnify:CR=1 FL=1
MNFINRNEIANGVYFTNIKDSRFKTMKISVNIVVPLSVETASENALVGGLLVRSCKKYPDFTVLSKKLSSLYGADLTSSLSKHGESQVIKISVSGLDDRYSLDDVSIAFFTFKKLVFKVMGDTVGNCNYIAAVNGKLCVDTAVACAENCI